MSIETRLVGREHAVGLVADAIGGPSRMVLCLHEGDTAELLPPLTELGELAVVADFGVGTVLVSDAATFLAGWAAWEWETTRTMVFGPASVGFSLLVLLPDDERCQRLLSGLFGGGAVHGRVVVPEREGSVGVRLPLLAVEAIGIIDPRAALELCPTATCGTPGRPGTDARVEAIGILDPRAAWELYAADVSRLS